MEAVSQRLSACRTRGASRLPWEECMATALVGTGFIGPVHLEALRRLGRHVVGVLGSTPERGEAAAKSLGLGWGYGRLEEIRQDASIDTLHIPSPNRHHFEQTRQALEAGKHVVVEKPLAMNVRESTELVRLSATRPGQIAAVCYNCRFYPL